MTPRRPASSQSGTRRVSRGARPRQVPAERTASSSGSGSAGSEPEGLPTTVPERVLPPRIVTLAVVGLLAFVVVFPSLRGYLSQRARYDAVVNEIADARATSSALEEEAARWQDEDYVRSQARERLSYVMPGETTYVVVGADQVGSGGTGDASEMTDETERSPWYEVLRDSARTAGGDEEGMSAVDPARQGWPTLSPAASDAPAAPGASAPAPTGR